MAVACQDVLISAAHRAHQQFVAHRPAIDDEILVARQSPVQGRQPRQPGEPKATALGFDRQRILRKVAAEQCGEPRRPVGDRRQPQQAAVLVTGDGKSDRRIGHPQAAHRIDRELALGARRLQEFEARRGRKKQIAHLDPRSKGCGGRHRRTLMAGLHRDFPGIGGVAGARDQAHAADGADRRQGFPAEPQCRDLRQRVVGEFRCAMALDRQRQLVGAHPGSVIGDRDQRLPAIVQGDIDPPRTGVDRVFDQFLDRCRRALDDLACGDAVDQDRRQQADCHRISLSDR